MPARRVDPSGKDMLEFVRRICEECGPRLGGSEAEAKAGELVYHELEKFCDTVHKDYFKCHPQAFLDYIWFTAGLYVAAAIAYFSGYFPISALLILGGFLLYHFQQNLHYEVIDFLFPEKESFHVYGKIKPKGKPRKIALLSAHHDSAYEFPLLGKLRKKGVYFILITVIITLLTLMLSIVRSLPFEGVSAVDVIQKPLLITGSVFLVTIALTLRSNRGVLGANDNLSALAAVIEAGKYLAKNRPEETEVWIISFAGEEHMRGSKRFVEKHHYELKAKRAVMLNYECISSEYFLLATEEKMYFVKHSRRAVELVKRAAEKVGVDVKVGPLPFAGSDAANFSRKGIDATVIFGLEKDGIPRYWHHIEDTPDKLDGSKLVYAAEIGIQFVYEVDRE